MQDGVLRESGPGAGMARDRGAAMLGAFVEGLGAGDVRSTRARFEQVVRDHLGVAFVRLPRVRGPARSSPTSIRPWP